MASDAVPYKPVKILEGVPLAGGLRRALPYLVFAPLTWAVLLLILVREFLRSPLAFFRRKPRASRPDELALPTELAGLQHEWLQVGGRIRLHAASFGRRPELPLVLFLHGFPECWYSWRRIMAEYRGRYEVVALDMRGYGWSDKPQAVSEYTLDRLTSDVAASVAALGRSSCTLVAHDWGGAVAWAAAGRYPGLAERLVLLAAPHLLLYKRNLTLEQAARSSYFLMFQIPLLPELLFSHTDGAVFDDKWLPVPDQPHAATANGDSNDAHRIQSAPQAQSQPAPQRAQRRRAPHPATPRTPGAFTESDAEVYKAAMLGSPAGPTAAINYYRALFAADAGLLPVDEEVERGLKRQLEMPVLVVWGADDHALLISNLVGVAEVAPRSEVHILPACSHWIQADQPAELSRILGEWLAANPLGGKQEG